MAEYIERGFALDVVKRTSGDYAAAFAEIAHAPAADVAEVRHARWDKDGRCTLCGGHAPFWAMASTYYKSPWRHECGARMGKEGEHD